MKKFYVFSLAICWAMLAFSFTLKANSNVVEWESSASWQESKDSLISKSGSDLTGQELRTWLKNNFYDGKHSQLSYSTARDKMYNFIDNKSGKVVCVYGGYEESKTYGGSGTSMTNINCEHTVPQSFFNKALPMRSDIHHLFPTYMNWNSIRGSNKFAEVDDNTTTKWMYKTNSSSSIPSSNIELYSESGGGTFEPREDHKGNCARAIFYFYTMYPTQAGTISKVADPDVLYQWHLNDPVDEAEIARNNEVEKFQGNRNPYIDNPEYVAQAWGFAPVSGGTDITLFKLDEEKQSAVINKTDHTVKITVVNGTNLTALTPQISISYGATINPASGVARDFTNPVSYTVTADDNSTSQEWTVTVTEADPAGSYSVPFIEDFTSVTANQDVDLEDWTLIAETGTRNWVGKDYQSNKYAQASSYQSGEANVAWLITPAIDLDKTAKETLSFDLKTGYYTHQGLSVLVSTDFDGTDVTKANWTDLTSEFTITAGPSDGYSEYANCGKVSLDSYKGKAFVAFRYTGDGNNGETGTFQIDNVKIEGEEASVGTEANITSFTFTEQAENALINTTDASVSIAVKHGTDVSKLVPSIQVSAGATISPASNVEQDFSSAVKYTVTSEDKQLSKDWTVTVTVADPVLSKAADITSFVLAEQTGEAVIDANLATVNIGVKAGTDVTKLSPSIEVSEKATISPVSGSVQDFTNAVKYTVTAEDKTTKDWTVKVTVAEEIPSQDLPFTEDFETVVNKEAIALSNWKNHNAVGTRFWEGRDYNNNKYAQMASYSSKEENEVWMITPMLNLDKTSDEVFSFDINVGYWKHNGLQILISQDYAGDVSSANWTDISSSFTIPTEPTNTYGTFAKAGEHKLGELKGKVVIAFKYTGSDNNGETTTYQIDNVQVVGGEASNATDILTFTLKEESKEAVINTENHTVVAEVVFGTDLTKLEPALTLSAGAMVSNTITYPADFTDAVVYTILAEDKTTYQNWTVTVTEAAFEASSETDILGFVLPEQVKEALIDIENHTVLAEVAVGTDLTRLEPELTLSPGAIVSNTITYPADFTEAVVYTILAEDKETSQEWTVTVKEGEPVTALSLPFTEDFTSVTANEIVNLEGWANLAETGSLQWIGKTHSENNYAQMSAYKSGEQNTAWLITPALNLDETDAEQFSFDVKVGYYTHEGLSILISNDFDGTNLSTATWVDVTENFTIPTEPANGYGEFVSAGKMDLSEYKGQVYIAFKYQGNDTNKETTTYQIDNVEVKEGEVVANTEANIVSFVLTEQSSAAVIDTNANTVNINVVKGTDLVALKPEIKVSEGASVNPVSGTAIDFSEAVTFVVTAENTNFTKEWTVNVKVDTEEEVLELPFAENFETLENNQNIVLDGWRNTTLAGERLWVSKIYSENAYAQFGSFGSKEANDAWLITPKINLDNTDSEILTFDVNVGYWKHEGLEILISEDYDGTNLSEATWTKLNSEFIIPNGPADAYGDFASAGAADLSSYSGAVNIAFRYQGDDNEGKTTTYQIDNVEIKEGTIERYTVTFALMNKQGESVEGMKVVFLNDTLSSNADGEVIFENVAPINEAAYKVLGNELYQENTGTVTVTNANKLVNILLEPLGLQDELANLTVYPNPVKDQLIVNGLAQSAQQINVLDVRGMLVLSINPAQQEKVMLNLSNLENGLYFIQIKHTQGTILKKIVKE